MGKLHIKSQEPGRFRLLFHILFWFVSWVIINLAFGYGEFFNTFSLLYSTFILLIAAAASYWIAYFLIPRFLIPGKYWLFLAYLVFSMVVSLDIELLGTMIYIVFLERFEFMSFFRDSGEIYSLLAGTYFIVFLFIAIRLAELWYNEQTRKQAALKEKVEAELKLLKSQIHPHFLFNTLNNIYSLSLQKSDQAPDAVLKLSELLDYLIYHGENEKVSLKKEADLIHNYIELEKLRYGERLVVDFVINGDSSRVMVAPLILIPLVENAFKHGISKSRNKQKLLIRLDISGRDVSCRIENTGPGTFAAKSSTNGTGLKNLQKRLDILYGDHYSLDILPGDGLFMVHLKLKT